MFPGKPDPAPSLPSCVQRSRSRTPARLPGVYPRPQPRPLAGRHPAGPLLGQPQQPGGPAAPPLVVGFHVARASPAGEQPQAPQLQPLPGAVDAGLPVSARGRGQGRGAARQPQSERHQPQPLPGEQRDARGRGTVGRRDDEPTGERLLKAPTRQPDAPTLPSRKHTGTRRGAPPLRQPVPTTARALPGSARLRPL